MKRFKEIKELLSKVYFDNEEIDCVIAFLENLGLKNSLDIVISQDNYKAYLQEEYGEGVEMRFMPAIDFFQECTGREIDDRYSLGTAVVMAIDDYISQVRELKERVERNKQTDKDINWRHKETLFAFAFMACSLDCSLKDAFEALNRDDEEVALNVLEALNSMMSEAI